MHVLTVPALLMCAAAAGAVGWTANRLSTGAGGPLLILPWASLAALAAVAAALDLHRNTIRYRLQQVVTLTGYDPAVTADRVHLYLALRVRALG